MKKMILSTLMLMLAVMTLSACGVNGKAYFGTYTSASGTDSVVINAKNFKWGQTSYEYSVTGDKITVAGDFTGGKTSVDFQIFENNQILSTGILLNFSSGAVNNRNGSLSVNLIEYSGNLSVISTCSLRSDNTFVWVFTKDIASNCSGKYTLKNGLLHFEGAYTAHNKPFAQYWYITENFNIHWQPYVKDINMFKPNQENPSDTYNLTYSADIGGTITGDTNQTVKSGQNGTSVTAVANEGYEFVRWSDGVTTATRQDSNIQENLVVTAMFEVKQTPPLNSYTLTYSAGLGGKIVGNANQTVEQGKNGTIVMSEADDGYKFIVWSDGVATATRQDEGVQENLAVTAIFEQKQNPPLNSYTLTYSADIGGTITGDTNQTVKSGQNGTSVTAIANEGYEFVRWSDGVTTAVRQDSNIQENLVVTAMFRAKQPETTVTYDYGFMHGGSNTSTFKAKKGENINLIALNRDGYIFEGWFYGDTQVENGIWQYDYDITLYAKWKVIEHTITYNLDGGIVENIKTKFTIEDLPLALQIPDKENMNFIGWYTSQTFDENSKVDTINKKQDFTLYAKYEDSAAALKYGYNEADASYFVSAYIGNGKKVVIPNLYKGKKVAAIGERAFVDCESLISVNIPEGVTSIGSSAFYGCRSLTNITIPKGVTSIGDSAFSFTDLTSITIPEGVTSIGTSAFNSCYRLTSITISKGVTSIGTSAFYNCRSLVSVTIPNGVKHIEYGTFSGCTSLTSITIPDSVTSIGSDTFRNCTNLTSINIPNSVTNIGDAAFWDCPKLATVYIDSLTIANEINATSHGYLLKFATTIYIKDDLAFSNSYICNVFTLAGTETVNDIVYKKYIS